MEKGQMSSSGPSGPTAPEASAPLPSAPPSYEEAVGLPVGISMPMPGMPGMAPVPGVPGAPPYPVMGSTMPMPTPRNYRLFSHVYDKSYTAIISDELMVVDFIDGIFYTIV